RLDGHTVTRCNIVLSAVASHPLEAAEAGEFMVGKRLDEESVRAAAEIAAKPAKPLDNADLSHFWRKRMVRVVVEQALEKAGDQKAGLGGYASRSAPRVIRTPRRQSGQGMVEYALILALVARIVIVALIATCGQLSNLFSNN